MKLNDIRRRTAYDPNALPTQKQAARAWLNGIAKDYPIALTLTLNQVIKEVTPKGMYYRQLSKEDCEKAAARFICKLNEETFGKNAVRRHNKGLNYIATIEGERSQKQLHLHLAIGGFPADYKFNQLGNKVRQAKAHVQNLAEQHKLDICDSGWVEYITKELGRKDTDNVLWHLA
jgi:hypothetical protein